ncbi:MAG: hypothetical protein LBT76_00990 [Tannerella sp.]|nr:hypothetical protein [Tannerella sp.]
MVSQAERKSRSKRKSKTVWLPAPGQTVRTRAGQTGLDAGKRLKEATAAVCGFVNRYPRCNGAVTDRDRLSPGLHIRDTELAPAPVPATCPLAVVTLPGIRQLSVAFRAARTDFQHGISP